MPKYALFGVPMLRVDIEADDPESADVLSRDMDHHNFALVEWHATGLFTIEHKQDSHGKVHEVLIPVPEFMQPELLEWLPADDQEPADITADDLFV